MKKILFILILHLTLVSFIFANRSNLNLSPEEKEYLKNNSEITVGVFNIEPYSFVDKEEITGFTINLLKKIALKAEIKLKFKVFDKIPERIKSLNNKDVELLTILLYSKEREKNIAYGKQFLELEYSIFLNNNIQKVNSLNDLKKIGIIKGHILNKIIKEQYPELEIVNFYSVNEVLNNLNKGAIDATILDKTVGTYKINKLNLKKIKVIDNNNLVNIKNQKLYGYSALQENNLLISILDKAYSSLDKNNLLNLLKDWSLNISSESPVAYEIDFSQEEIDWLKNKEYFSVASIDDFHPFSFIENKESLGYSIDSMKLFGEVLNKEIRFNQEPWNEQLEMLKRGEIDLIPHVAVNENRKKFITYTDFTHLTFSIGFIVQKNSQINSMKDLKDKKLAVVNRYYLHDYLEEMFPEQELLLVNSTNEVVKSVATGKAFAGIDNLPTLNYFIQENWANNLTTTTVNDLGISLETGLPMGVKKGNFILKSILEKVNSALPRNEISRLKQKWLNPDLSRVPKLIQLTQDEQEYLDTKKEILMCIDPSWMPYEAIVEGEHIGMSSDYFEIFEHSIGKPIKLVLTENWTESLEKGKARECDIFSLVMSTKERRKYLDFTKTYSKTPLVLATQPNEPWVRDFDKLIGKKLAIVKGYAYVEILREKYPMIDLIEVNNLSEGLAAVEDGQYYGFIGALTTIGYNMQNEHLGLIKISGKFKESLELGIGVRNDEPLLKSIFNKAIDNLTSEDHQRILNKWVDVQLENNPNELTQKELEFIKNHPVIRFFVRKNRPPFSLERNGEAAGIAVDYLNKISEKIGLKVEFVLGDSPMSSIFDSIETNRENFDTITFSVKSEEREKRFAFGDTFMSYPMMIITNKNSPYIGKTADLINKTVAVEEAFLTNKWLKRDYPDIKIISVPSTKEALDLVNKGQVDAYIGNLAIANYMITNGGMNNLKIQAPSGYGDINYSFIAPKEWPELASILSKGYNLLSPQEHNIIQQKWFSLQLVERFNYELFWRILSLILIALGAILYWNRKLLAEKNKTKQALYELHETQNILKQKYKELEELSITDKLTQLFNRTKLDEILNSEFERAQRFNTSFGVILLDIDHFKSVNDTYGHQIGDVLLTEFADILRSNFRKVDTVGRWGGEEFLIICPEINKEDLVSLANKIKVIIEQADFSEVRHKTASFGCSLYSNDSFIDNIITRADDALYESKRSGRNGVTFK